MAIIDTLPAVDVSVRLNNSFDNAAEYPDPNPYRQERYLGGYERCSRNYIESQHDAEFCINIRVTDDRSIDPWVYDDYGFLFFLYIDGIFMGKRFCLSKDFSGRQWRFTFSSRTYPNADRSSLVKSRFKFQSIVAVDDEPTDGDFRRARDVGTIEVKLKLGKLCPMVDRRQRRNLERDFREPDVDHFEIPEEALKGRPIYHGTSFTAPESLPGGPPRGNAPKSITGALLATYNFKSDIIPEALKVEGIIPRTPSPEPALPRKVRLEKSGDVPRFEDLYHDEVERLARERLRQLRDERLQTSSLRRRTYDDYCDLTEEDENEPARPYKTIRTERGHDIIDLTGCY
ncbi:hypothetical protein CGRA01v4_00980 [Colletotrichum graminicola]|uniref:DUF7918 domain-containing protein n=1 Tax=Colletotrichum graminicola (strain M1.001 / M2 / FGSC 10212) TaxID=645133 RepID=E3QGW8_COLGM|nr:uncharacterized protein GLRG_05250 [Colletotrichum graminicola M1.001]EFQ30106.1 hypothetical protein GLRG_05250 [Colletotrichum graminicola M1.001]WDK09702.1 hypothetical protein CGRA01v4_00980 [Colletotrichum graminicola]